MIDFSITGESEVGDGIILVRGHDIGEVVREFTFEDSVFYQVAGKLPTDEQRASLRHALVHSETMLAGYDKHRNFEKTAGNVVLCLDDKIEHITESIDSHFPQEVSLLTPILHHVPVIAAQYMGTNKEVSSGDLLPETFEQYIFTTMLGRMPDAREELVMQAYLVSLCEHANTSPSTPGAQIVSNLRGDFYKATLTFMLAADTPYHFGALPEAMRNIDELLENRDNLKEYLAEIVSRPFPENIIPGFGHRYQKTSRRLGLSPEEIQRRAELIDPRVDVLLEISDELGVQGDYIDIIRRTGRILYDMKGIPINVDGIGASFLKQFGFPSETSLAFVYMGRMPMIARYHLEQQKQKPNTLWRPVRSVVNGRTVSRDFSNNIRTEINNYSINLNHQAVLGEYGWDSYAEDSP